MGGLGLYSQTAKGRPGSLTNFVPLNAILFSENKMEARFDQTSSGQRTRGTVIKTSSNSGLLWSGMPVGNWPWGLHLWSSLNGHACCCEELNVHHCKKRANINTFQSYMTILIMFEYLNTHTHREPTKKFCIKCKYKKSPKKVTKWIIHTTC